MNPEETQNSAPKKSFSISPGAGILVGAVIISIVLLLKLPGSGSTTKPTTAENKPVTSVDAKVLAIRSTDHVYGNPETAKIIAVEYSDSDCPYCQQFHNTMKQAIATYKGDIAWVYRYFPLSIHPNAQNEAIALECSAELGGNDAFFKYLDKAINITVTPDQSADTLIGIATNLGLDKALFTKCLTSDAVKRVESDTAEAQEIGAQGTPFTILVNKDGEQVVMPGAYPWENVKQYIDTLLK